MKEKKTICVRALQSKKRGQERILCEYVGLPLTKTEATQDAFRALFFLIKEQARALIKKNA